MDAGQALLAQWRWQKVPHVVREDDETIHCTRCGGWAPRCQRSHMAGRRCPAWMAVAPGDGGAAAAKQDWGAILCDQLGLKVAGAGRRTTRQARLVQLPLRQPDRRGRATSAPPAAARAVELRPRPPHTDRQEGLQWRSHAAIQGPRTVACAICGSTARGWTSLAASGCRGWSPSLPPAVRALIVSGLHVRAGGPALLLAAALSERLA